MYPSNVKHASKADQHLRVLACCLSLLVSPCALVRCERAAYDVISLLLKRSPGSFIRMAYTIVPTSSTKGKKLSSNPAGGNILTWLSLRVSSRKKHENMSSDIVGGNRRFTRSVTVAVTENIFETIMVRIATISNGEKQDEP